MGAPGKAARCRGVPPSAAPGTYSPSVDAFDASTYYATAAQVIPTLLLAAALEHRWLSADAAPTGDEVKADLMAYIGVAVLALLAVLGTLTAFLVLAGEPPPGARILTLLGLVGASTLVLNPLAFRALLTPLQPLPRVHSFMRGIGLPGVFIVATLVATFA